MTLSVNQSSQNLNLRDLIKDRRDANKQMQSDVGSGNLAAAQNDLQQMQTIQQQIGSLTGTTQDDNTTSSISSLSSTDTSSQTTPATLINDLKTFIQSIMSGSDQNTLTAQQQLQNDFTNLLGSSTTANASTDPSLATQATSQQTNPSVGSTGASNGPTKAHHHHHHHNDNDGDNGSQNTDPLNSSTSSTSSTSATSSLFSAATASQLDNYNTNPITSIDGARQAALNAYTMLMQYTNTSTGITSSSSSQLNMLL